MSGTAISPASPPASSTATASLGRTTPPRATASTRTSCWSTPYARALAGPIAWDKALYGYRVGSPYTDLTIGKRDSAPYAPRSVVVDPAFDWGDDQRPNTPLQASVIYELHVKGFTKTHPDVPANLCGSYAGLGSAPAIAYLKQLGVTAVELLPPRSLVLLAERTDGPPPPPRPVKLPGSWTIVAK